MEARDREADWELDRCVTNWKKMVRKTKRQTLMMSNDNAAAVPSTSNAEVDGVIYANPSLCWILNSNLFICFLLGCTNAEFIFLL